MILKASMLWAFKYSIRIGSTQLTSFTLTRNSMMRKNKHRELIILSNLPKFFLGRYLIALMNLWSPKESTGLEASLIRGASKGSK
jgi:hypothetical protein